MAQLEKDKTASRMEVVIPINLRGLVKGLHKICFEQPVAITGILAEKADVFSHRLMTGRLAVLTMPAGIILRNASRTVLGSTSEKRGAWWGGFSYVSGFIGGASAWYFAGKATMAALGSTVVGSTIGSWGTLGLGAIISAPVTLPAFGAAFLTGTAVAASVVAVASLVPAVANLGVACKRTIDAWKGISYDNSVLQPNSSLTDRLRQRRNGQVIEAFYRLPANDIKKVHDDLTARLYQRPADYALGLLSGADRHTAFVTLKQEFEGAAAPQNSTPAPATQQAPAHKPKRPGE